MDVPTPELAVEIAENFHGKQVRRLTRFSLGLCHHVYDVETDGAPFVVRIAANGNESMLRGTMHWTPILRSVGVPVASILAAELDKTESPFAYLILERLPGSDLAEVHEAMDRATRMRLGSHMGELQARVAGLPAGRGFGSARSHDDPELVDCWQGVLDGLVQRVRHRWSAGAGYSPAQIERLEGAIQRGQRAWSGVTSRPFMEDATTKNVIIAAGGTLSGIVDLDTLGFGDPLFALALTRAAFAKHGWGKAYPDAWAEQCRMDAAAEHRLALYTALFCLDILSEQGAQHNRAEVLAFPGDQISRLLATFETEISKAV
jgi:aminoglycoside phosphotransferase (APT) family kinase protein